MTERYQLSRRKTLAGLATIGAAGAGAGLGTSALFSDEETFADNVVEAGTLDMTVTAEVVSHVDNGYWDGLELTDETYEADGDPGVGLEVADIKPGDWAVLCFTVAVESNPGYVTLHAENFTEAENGLTDPESEVDETEDDGELDEKLLLTYWDNYDEDSGDRSGLNSLDNITNAASNVHRTDFDWEPSDEDGVVDGADPAVEYTNVREFYFGRDGDETDKPTSNDPLGAGFASGDGILVGGTSEPTIVGDPDVAGDYDRVNDEGELEFCLLLDLHEDVGNEVQGDSVGLDLRFSTEQVRNNTDPRSGTWDGY